MDSFSQKDESLKIEDVIEGCPEGIFYPENPEFFKSPSWVALVMFSGFFVLLHFIPTFIGRGQYKQWFDLIFLVIIVVVYLSFTLEIMVFNRFFPESLAGRSLDLRATRLFLIFLLPASLYFSYNDHSFVFDEPNYWLLVTFTSGLLLYFAVTKKFFNPHREVISGACRIVENHISSVPINPDWPLERLGSLCSIEEGRISVNFLSSNGTVPFVRPEDLAAPEIDIVARLITPEEATATYQDIFGNWVSRLEFIPAGSIVFRFKGPLSEVRNLSEVRSPSFTQILSDIVIDKDIAAIIPRTHRVEPKFLAIILRQMAESCLKDYGCTSLTPTEWRINTLQFLNVLIPVPPLNIQKQVVADIEIEERAVRASKELIKRAGWRRSVKRRLTK